MKYITVAGVTVQVDSEGRACLEDLHRAAVAAGYVSEAYRPENFLALPSTKALLERLRRAGVDALAESPLQPKLNVRDAAVLAEVVRQLKEIENEDAAAGRLPARLPALNLQDPMVLADLLHQLRAFDRGDATNENSTQRLEGGR